MPANVHSGKISHLERPHGHAEGGMHAVDLFGRRAFQQQLRRIVLARNEHAVTNEAVTDA